MNKITLQQYIADAFTDKVFSGNPASEKSDSGYGIIKENRRPIAACNSFGYGQF